MDRPPDGLRGSALVARSFFSRVSLWAARQRELLSRLTVPQFTACCGALVIAVGSALLWLPCSHHQPVTYWEALFTAVSAVTVTGLSIVDPGTDLNLFGQLILLALILVGGLGLMAISIYLQGFVHQGARLRRRVDSGEKILDQFGVGGVGRTFWHIARVALGLMVAGATLLFLLDFAAQEPLPRRLWSCLFHAASAYNNAGFSLREDSLKGVNVPSQLVVMGLIVSGGLGYRVHAQLRDGRNWFPLRWRRLDLHAKVVLLSSLLLILVGWLGLLLYEAFNSSPDSFQALSATGRFWAALFQSVSARTAGFESISLGGLSDGSLVLLMVLMFVGASPGGTGGGLKTSTMAILLAATASTLRRREDVVLLSRTIDTKLVIQAAALVVSSLLFVSAMVLLIAVGAKQDPDLAFLNILFTCISAFATVGFDVGILQELGQWGQLVLMVGMFVGRLGLLLLFSALVQPFPRTTLVRYPREQLTV